MEDFIEFEFNGSSVRLRAKRLEFVTQVETTSRPRLN